MTPTARPPFSMPAYLVTVKRDSQVSGVTIRIIIILIESGAVRSRLIHGEQFLYVEDVPRLREFWLSYRDREARRAGCPVLHAVPGRIYVFRGAPAVGRMQYRLRRESS